MDDQFLALALTAEVDVVVSSDEDLPVLNPWRGISIVTPVEFLSRFKSK
jgi:predicted nucleic acid-binding protein